MTTALNFFTARPSVSRVRLFRNLSTGAAAIPERTVATHPLLAPNPMTPDEVADLVERVRRRMILFAEIHGGAVARDVKRILETGVAPSWRSP